MTFAVMFALAVASASQDQSGEATASNQTTILITTIVGFLSLLATQGFTMWRERQAEKARERQREWDLQDRASAREELRRRAEETKDEVRRSSEAQRMETIATAVQLARAAKRQNAELTDKLDRNTELTQMVGAKADAAYEVGNNFSQRLKELRDELSGKRAQIDHIEQVSEDTNEKVTELKEVTEKEGRP